MLVLRSLLLSAVVLSLVRTAAAQTTPTTPTTPTTSTFTASDFQIRFQKPVDGGDYAFFSQLDYDQFFNRARCECKTPIRVRVDLTASGSLKRMTTASIPGNAEIRIGNVDCVSSNPATFQAAKCSSLATLSFASLVKNGASVNTTVDAFFQAPNVGSEGTCSIKFTQSVWLMIDSNPIDRMPDSGLADGSAPTKTANLDGEAPTAPSAVTVTPGNEALNVSWASSPVNNDVISYVVFCSRAGAPVFSPSFYTSTHFSTPKTLCPKTTAAQTEWTYAVADGPPATAVSAPESFRKLDTDFVCSDLVTSGTEARIKILQNGIPYLVGVAAVDQRGNASPITTAYVQTPIPTRDFYQGYREAGGAADGGYCAFADRGRPAAWAVAGLATLTLALVRRRRR